MFVIRDRAIRNLLLQRTTYAEALRNAKARPAAVLGLLYFREMVYEFNTIRDHLPVPCASILDIGCGLAGIDVLLSRHVGGAAAIALVDKDGTPETVYYGFEAEAAHYNDLDTTREFLTENGVRPEAVRTFDVNRGAFPPAGDRFDLVLSLISWGFHSPVETAVDAVRRALAPTGTLILDVRLGTDGTAVLRRHFASVATIHTTTKYHRVAAREPRPEPLPADVA